MLQIPDSPYIEYKSGYKYQLAGTCVYNTGIMGYEITSEYLSLYKNGLLVILKGYCWDGPSGPTVDTKTFMRGSLIHDAIYQLIREGKLPMQVRQIADHELRTVCLQDGMMQFRAWYVYHSVDIAAADAANPKNKKKVIKAP